MSKIKYVDGNIVDFCTNGYVIVHGVNAQGMMGAGVALVLAKAFPQILIQDINAGTGNPDKLGTINVVPLDIYPEYNIEGKPRECTVINACTQFRYGAEKALFGYKTQKALREDSIRKAFKEIKRLWGKTGTVEQTFVIPKIGAGLAKGDWSRISKIIEEELFEEKIVCINYKN